MSFGNVLLAGVRILMGIVNDSATILLNAEISLPLMSITYLFTFSVFKKRVFLSE